MGELNSLIMSIDLNRLIPIGAGAFVFVSLLTYLLVKPKKKKELIQNPTPIEKTPEESHNIKETEILSSAPKIDDQYLKSDPETPSNKDSNIFNEILEESKESRLQDDTLSSFSEQFNVQINESRKEPFIENNLVSQNLEGTVLTKDEISESTINSTANEGSFYGPKTAEETKEFWQKYGTDLSSQEQNNIKHQNEIQAPQNIQEDIFKSLLVESEKVDQQREEQNQIDNNNFNTAFGHIYNENSEKIETTENVATSQNLITEKTQTEPEKEKETSSIVEQFGDLAGIISNDRKITAEEEQSNKELNSNLDVWVNYMCMKQGKMRLLNTFVHLNSPWGTMESISQIQKQIDQEAGFDEQGFKQSWAIISVIPIKQ